MTDTLAFARCAGCDGLGFVAVGAIPDRSYRACAGCGGAGQVYLAPAPAPPAKPAPMPDLVVF